MCRLRSRRASRDPAELRRIHVETDLTGQWHRHHSATDWDSFFVALWERRSDLRDDL